VQSLRQLADVAYMVLLSSEELLTAQVELGAALYVVKPYTPLASAPHNPITTLS
jgi:hypothetical protein